MRNLLQNLKSLQEKWTRKEYLFLGIMLLLILTNCIAVIKELPIIPIITAGAVLIYLLVAHVNWVMFLMALSTPFSIVISSKDVSLGLSLPSEAMMIGITCIFILHILYDYHLDRNLLRHPISVAIYVYLLWMLLTCITSEIPIVSFKYLASKIWFIVSSYWMVIQLIKENNKNLVKYVSCYAIGLAVVVIITTYKHALSGFDKDYMHWVMSPFYNDHTAYGAILAFFLPITVGFFFLPQNNVLHKILFATLSIINVVGLYLSFSRAAWLSIMAAAGVYVVLKLRIKLSWLIVGGLILGSALFFYADDILYKMSRNSQDSSGDLTEQIQSISNISTDASNVERLNRWYSAFNMVRERPVLGWGPGTYQFTYAPFQKNQFKTIISTNFGDGGSCHSEYFGPCAESGIPGMLTVFGLLFCSLITGIRTYNRSNVQSEKIFSLVMTLALISYYVHGLMNSFLETDKLSLPFWLAFAVIVVMNIRMRQRMDENRSS